jgi:hypothetical protein
MGDRRMAEIKTEDGSLFVYTHSYGYEFPRMARAAVAAAKPRLGESYWTRIVVDQLTKPGRDSELGFGLMLKPDHEDEYNDDKPSIIIDGKDGSVTVIGEDPGD